MCSYIYLKNKLNSEWSYRNAEDFMSSVDVSFYRVRQISFFLENALKQTTEYFLKFLFLFESTILPFNNGK